MADSSVSEYLRSDETVLFKTKFRNEFKVYTSPDPEKILRVQGNGRADLREQARVPLDEVVETNTGRLKAFVYGHTEDQSSLYITDQRLLLVVDRDSEDLVVEFPYEDSTISWERTSDIRYNYIRADGLRYAFEIWPSDCYEAESCVLEHLKHNKTKRELTANATLFEGQILADVVIRDRLEDIVAETETAPTPNTIFQSQKATRRWLNVWARWESFRTIASTERTDVAVTHIEGVGETIGTNLIDEGYETLSDIRSGTIESLMKIEGLGEQRATRLYEQACYRTVDQISGIEERTALQLNQQGFRTAADISAAQPSTLADIESIDKKRAQSVQAKAASWLPESGELPAELPSDLTPPFDDAATAETAVDMLERLVRHDNGESAVKVAQNFAANDAEISRETILERCLGEQMGDHTEDPGEINSWTDVLARTAALSTSRDAATLPNDVCDEFDITAVDSPAIDPTSIVNLPLLEATERVAEVETATDARSRFIRAVLQAHDIIECSEECIDVEHSHLESGIRTQVTTGWRTLTNKKSSEAMDTLLQYTFACRDALQASDAYEEYPFNIVVESLGKLGQRTKLPVEEVNRLHRIVSISELALDTVHSLSYNHPAIDHDFWTECITLALTEQYEQALQPINKQLERLEDGIWEAKNLHTLDWRAFEKLIGDLYRYEGYNVEITQSSNDLGVDIWAHKGGKDVAIQVKQFQPGQSVGRETLQKLVSTLAKGDADRAVVVTSSEFAGTSRRYAADFGPELSLIASDELVQRLSESDIPPSVSDT